MDKNTHVRRDLENQVEITSVLNGLQIKSMIDIYNTSQTRYEDDLINEVIVNHERRLESLYRAKMIIDKVFERISEERKNSAVYDVQLIIYNGQK